MSEFIVPDGSGQEVTRSQSGQEVPMADNSSLKALSIPRDQIEGSCKKKDLVISSLKDDEPDVLGPSQEGKPVFLSHSKDPPFPLAEASELRDEGNPVRKRRKHKCIRVKLDKVKVVLGLDVGLEKVEGLMKLALVGRFMGK